MLNQETLAMPVTHVVEVDGPRGGGPRPTLTELRLGVAANWWHLCGEVCELVRVFDAAERCYWRELEADVTLDGLARPARVEGREAFFGGDR